MRALNALSLFAFATPLLRRPSGPAQSSAPEAARPVLVARGAHARQELLAEDAYVAVDASQSGPATGQVQAAAERDEGLPSPAQAAASAVGLAASEGSATSSWQQVVVTELQPSAVEQSLAAGIMMAVYGVIWMMCCMGERRSTYETDQSDFRTGGNFAPASSLFQCCNARVVTMLETLCCWEFMWAETMGKIGLLSFTTALAFVVCLHLLAPFTMGATAILFFFVRLYTRNWLRVERRQGSGSDGSMLTSDWCMDIFGHLCCACCAVEQEAEYVEIYGKHFIDDRPLLT